MNEFMKEAIKLSESNLLSKDGGPFGAVIVKDGKIIGKGKNSVIKNNDPTAHGEVMAIRDACSNIKSFDLSGCTIYTSSYPCPMCLSATIWSNIKKVYYATTKEDTENIGFRDDLIYDFINSNMSDKNILDLEELNRKEALDVFDEYMKDSNKVEY